MSFIPSAPSPVDTDRIAAAISWLRQGFYAQAFVLLSGLQQEREPAARFAMGLCHLHAGELDAAVSCFEQALRFVKATPPQAPGMAEKGETYLKLARKQIEEEAYLSPIDRNFFAEFPKAAEQMVLLALVHVYRQKGMAELALKLAGGLVGPIFEEYKLKLQEDISHGHLHN